MIRSIKFCPDIAEMVDWALKTNDLVCLCVCACVRVCLWWLRACVSACVCVLVGGVGVEVINNYNKKDR